VGFDGIINPCPLRAFCQRIFPAFVNFSPKVLTDLFNRRSLERALEEFFTLCKQSKMSFSLVLIDLDDFKYVNDNYGHHVGDLVLAKVAKVLRTNMRAKDIVGRWGGDEFMAILPNTDLENAKKIVERIKFQIEKWKYLQKARGLRYL
jgi:diguanylate cyclase